MFSHKDDKEEVLKHTKSNQDTVKESDNCGCLGCGAIFPAGEVTEWIEEVPAHHKGQVDRTAICPHCGDALIIGDRGGYEITPAFIESFRMR